MDMSFDDQKSCLINEVLSYGLFRKGLKCDRVFTWKIYGR